MEINAWFVMLHAKVAQHLLIAPHVLLQIFYIMELAQLHALLVLIKTQELLPAFHVKLHVIPVVLLHIVLPVLIPLYLLILVIVLLHVHLLKLE